MKSPGSRAEKEEVAQKDIKAAQNFLHDFTRSRHGVVMNEELLLQTIKLLLPPEFINIRIVKTSGTGAFLRTLTAYSGLDATTKHSSSLQYLV